jgi:hypothetical protein
VHWYPFNLVCICATAQSRTWTSTNAILTPFCSHHAGRHACWIENARVLSKCGVFFIQV